MEETAMLLKEEISVFDRLNEICNRYHGNESALIQILLEVQQELNWLPKEVLLWLSERLEVPLNRLYEITTFYKVFSLIPRGKNLIKICTGTACHIRKAPVILSRVTQLLGIGPGDTTKDLRFTLKTVGCLGCCALGPVMVLNDEYYSNPTVSELEKLFAECR